MTKRKLDDNKIINIAKEYANGDITQLSLSLKYNLTRALISKYLEIALLECLVDQKTAELIADIAIQHHSEAREKLGIPKTTVTNAIVKKYEKLLDKYYEKKKQNDMELKISNQIY